MKRLILGVGFIVVACVLVWQAVENISNKDLQSFRDFYEAYLTFWERYTHSRGPILDKASFLKNRILEVLDKNIDYNNSYFIEEIKKLIEFSKRKDLLILFENGEIEKVIDELDKIGLKIDLNSYNDMCLNTPLDQQTEKMHNFMNAFKDCKKLESFDLDSIGKADKFGSIFAVFAALCFIASIALIVFAVKDKSTIFQHPISELKDYNWLGCDMSRNKSLNNSLDNN